MARQARKKSSTGIYHVLVRAIHGLSLFSDQEDTQYYVDIINDLQQKGYCELYAYALFPTHAHLLIREGIHEELKGNSQSQDEQSSSSEPIGSIMKRLASAYSYFFNVKYEHFGPIYMERFKSNPVESKDYFLKVLNHIGSQPTESKYTCHHIPSGLKPAITPEYPILEYVTRKKRVTESNLLIYLQEQHHFTNIGEFLQRDDKEQEEVIRSCKKYGGSIRQIERLTGKTFAYIFRVRTDL